MDDFDHLSNNWTSVHGVPLKSNKKHPWNLVLQVMEPTWNTMKIWSPDAWALKWLGRLPWSIKGGAQRHKRHKRRFSHCFYTTNKYGTSSTVQWVTHWFISWFLWVQTEGLGIETSMSGRSWIVELFFMEQLRWVRRWSMVVGQKPSGQMIP